MEFSRQEYWSRLPFPSPGGLPDPGFKPRSPALQADSLLSEPPAKPYPISVEDPYPGGYSVSHIPSKPVLGPENLCFRKHLQQGRSKPVPSLCWLSAEMMDFVLNHKSAEVTALSHNNEELNWSTYYRPGTILSRPHTLQHSFSFNPRNNPKR